MCCEGWRMNTLTMWASTVHSSRYPYHSTTKTMKRMTRKFYRLVFCKEYRVYAYRELLQVECIYLAICSTVLRGRVLHNPLINKLFDNGKKDTWFPWYRRWRSMNISNWGTFSWSWVPLVNVHFGLDLVYEVCINLMCISVINPWVIKDCYLLSQFLLCFPSPIYPNSFQTSNLCLTLSLSIWLERRVWLVMKHNVEFRHPQS